MRQKEPRGKWTRRMTIEIVLLLVFMALIVVVAELGERGLLPQK